MDRRLRCRKGEHSALHREARLAMITHQVLHQMQLTQGGEWSGARAGAVSFNPRSACPRRCSSLTRSFPSSGARSNLGNVNSAFMLARIGSSTFQHVYQ